MQLRASIGRLAILSILLILPIKTVVPQSKTQVALQPGATIPAFELKDQDGQTQRFDSLKGTTTVL